MSDNSQILDAIVSKWRSFVEELLVPAAASTGEKVEFDISCNEFLSKQKSLLAAALATEASAPPPGPVALEIGFGAGFSAALLLLSSPSLKLTCVDIGSHAYTRPCFEKLFESFPDRISLVIGDSRVCVPLLRHKISSSIFDLVHIDGSSLPNVALMDIANCAQNLSPGALVFMDDTRTDSMRQLWLSESVKHAIIQIPTIETEVPGFVRSPFYDMRRYACLAFYTVFCGPSGHIADAVLRPPSEKFPCFFFSNNSATLSLARKRGWIAVDVSVECPPWNDDVISASQSKPFKAVPHRRPELADFDYTIYVDSKRSINVRGAGTALEKLVASGKALLVKQHPSRDIGVNREFDRAMTLPRYASQRRNIVTYVNDMLKRPGMSNDQPNVWTTMVARNMRHPRCREVGDTWMQDIERCGIECQISAFFLQQTHADSVIVDNSADTPVMFDVTSK